MLLHHSLVADEAKSHKGFGFADYFDRSTAESAVRNLNKRHIKGRELTVQFAQDKDREGAKAEAKVWNFMLASEPTLEFRTAYRNNAGGCVQVDFNHVRV